MFINRSTLRRLFCTSVRAAQGEVEKAPVWSRPYDPRKYETMPSQKLKLSTGYTFLEVEPFPRARLMRLGYLILDKIKLCPEDSNYRMFTEEKIKWVMEKVDATEDIRELEKIISGGDAIEITIQEMHNEYKLIDYALGKGYLNKEIQPWIADPDYELNFTFRSHMPEEKYRKENRPAREKAQFLEAKPGKQ